VTVVKFMKLAIKLCIRDFGCTPRSSSRRASASLIDEEESQLPQLLSRADEDVDQLIPVCEEAPAYG